MPAETLFALASAPGRAAIAVWRLSGPLTQDAVRILTARAPPPARQALVRRLIDPVSLEMIDRALVLWFPGPASFTGEDSAEFHLHGGRAVSEALAAALGKIPGLRHAEPGEFSRRAFMNGKLGLIEAEAISDLTMAETDAQRRQALIQAEGGLSLLYDCWRDRLIHLRANLEAAIEFPDDDIGDPFHGLADRLRVLQAEIAAHLADSRRGERLRQGLTIAVIGAPNAGKSSLVNALARRDVAIVSPDAGTTRDVIEVLLDLDGYPVVLMDTAGLREPEGAVEAEGITRARVRAESADLVLALFTATERPDKETLALLDDRAIVILSKVDLGAGSRSGCLGGLEISVTTGFGLDKLLDRITDRIAGLVHDTGAPPPTRARHREALKRCLDALEAAWCANEPELSAEDLRRAADELGRVTGRIDVDEMLDSIFREFCIGK